MSLQKLLFSFSVAAFLVLPAACVSESDDDGDPDTSQNGQTPCGSFPDDQPKTCQAGQYCADEIFSECVNGCLSNTNCASDQVCDKPAGLDVGTCQGEGTTVSCADVCAKLQACDPSITQAQCDQFCAGTNETCKSCVVGANCPALNEGTTCMAECGVQE